MWLEEKPCLKPFVVYAFEESQKMYTVRIDNSILFKGNYYSVPQGTYKGRSSLVGVSLQGDKLIIKDDKGNFICSHILCTDRGKKITNTNHKRDKSMGIDNLLLETAMKFPDYEKAKSYLQQVRKRKNRYARDQLGAIKQAIIPAAPKVVANTLQYCMDNAIYSATDFIAVLKKQFSYNKQEEPFNEPTKIQSPLAKNMNELIPNVSDIFKYEQLMKN